MPVVFSKYPRWIVFNGDRKQLPPHVLMEDILDDGVLQKDKVKILIESEEAEFAIEDDIRKKAIKQDLKENYGIDIELRKYVGSAGMGALEAFYAAAKSDKKKTKK